MARPCLPGKPYPLGATWDGTGVNFALYSENATKVELCLYDGRSRRESDRINCRNRPPSSGMAMCQIFSRGSSTVIAFTDRGSRRAACGSILPSC